MIEPPTSRQRRHLRSIRPTPRPFARWWKAQVRYVRIALTLFWRSLLTIFLVWLFGALSFYFLQLHPEGHELSLPEALFSSLMMMAAQPIFPFPESFLLRLVYFALPVLGLVLVAETIVRFGLLLLDKRANEKEWMKAMADTAKDHIILCGIGSIGFRILEELVLLGQEVVAIERNPQGLYNTRARDLGATVLIGDSTAEAVLLKAGLERAKAVIAATDNDISNLETVLDAKRMRPGIRVVMRIFDQNTAVKLREAFGIETLSSSALSAPTFALSALGTDIVGSVRFGDLLLVTVELTVPKGAWEEKTLGELAKRYQVVVLGFSREAKEVSFAPALDTQVRAGDKLLLQGPLEAIEEARAAALG